MNKALYILLMFTLLLPRTNETDVGEETERLTEIRQVEEALEEEERALSGELRLDGSYDAAGALARLWESFLTHLKESFHRELGFALSLVGIAALCGLAGLFCPDKTIGEELEIAACCMAALLLGGSAGSVVREAEDALFRLSDYGKAAFPAFFSAVAACGTPVSASVKYASVCFAVSLFMELAQRLILPMIYAYLSVSFCSSISGNAMLNAAGRFLKWSAVTMMSLLAGGFSTYIGLSGAISGSADAAAVKAAKTVISTTLPVVGGILSDSASTMLAAASLIRNSAGVFCLIAVCLMCAGPFALLTVKMLLLKGASVLSEMGGKRYAGLLSSAGNVMGMLLGLVGCFAVMLFFSFMCGIRMGTG